MAWAGYRLWRSQGGTSMSSKAQGGHVGHETNGGEKRRVMITQLLKSPVFNHAGEQVGRVVDFIAKLADSRYPPLPGGKVDIGGNEVFVGRQFIEKLEPGAARLNTNSVDMTPFQRRAGEVLLASD